MAIAMNFKVFDMCEKTNYSVIKTIESFPNEEWRDIDGFNGMYQVSSLGRVKSFKGHGSQKRYEKGRILAQCDNGHGYLSVILCINKKQVRRYVHRLVAQAFIPNTKNKSEVNHINEFEKWNNTVENLEWIDHISNVNYGTHNRRIANSNSGRANPNCCKPVIKLSINGDYIERYESSAAADRANGLPVGCISRCCCAKNHCYSSGGFLWCYESDYSQELVNDMVANYKNRYRNRKHRVLSEGEIDESRQID